MFKVLYLLVFNGLYINNISCEYDNKKMECYFIQDAVMKGVVCGVSGYEMVEMK